MTDEELNANAETVKAQMHALVDASFHFNSDLTQIIGRDNNETILFVALFARGEAAEAIAAFLAARDEEQF